MSQDEPQAPAIKGYDKLIRATSVGSEQPVFMIATNRWDYMNKYMKDFNKMISSEMNMYILGGIGLYLLLIGNLLAVVALAGAAYYYPQFKHGQHQINSQRRVILGN
ncbi:MAG: hypothetical protein Q8R15_02455 [Candidatus Micrarchaeota archaeon]|nr:hypothetical protein [Candidatus Micrarchaeota archaeon]